eukprot:CAMPEP_0116901170 /NCGR_PEP_ID=MMETSP0467-20121206/9170_1 /TAXON_ID=283647 /ORGANISM="Mesodinium pulex, Strain SPMC105" /LENGTH=118 /DNA_ID=CAMNT_0004574585 /DNA_START=849 /DNA_END=1205 /DNA_ORIENTATION=+
MTDKAKTVETEVFNQKLAAVESISSDTKALKTKVGSLEELFKVVSTQKCDRFEVQNLEKELRSCASLIKELNNIHKNSTLDKELQQFKKVVNDHEKNNLNVQKNLKTELETMSNKFEK